MTAVERKGIGGESTQDVVVVGAGMAGLIAAIEAVSAGARVTLLDKLRPVAGGGEKVVPEGGIGNETSLSGGGSISRFSLGASVEDLLRRHVERGWGRVDSTLIRNFLERLADDCKWLRDDLGLPYDGTQVKGRGPALHSHLCCVADEKGVNMLFAAKALRLLTDDVGKVLGVRARYGERVTDFKAGATILATGGFEGNHEMMLKYAGPDITYGTVFTGCPTNTGDGHLMASEIGAQLINLSTCHLRTTDRINGLDPSRRLQNIYPLGIYVNGDCKRFVDEGTADSDTLGNAIVRQPGSKATLIFDENAKARYPEEYETYPKKEEVIKTAGTVEELAVKIDVSPEKLRRLVSEFNGGVKDGKALGLNFPKTDRACRIETPPFYAMHPVSAGLDHPLGGLKINNQSQVVDMENNPITGLYAAGSLVNWSFGKPYTVSGITSYIGTYYSGASSGLPTALVFGRIAGRIAAREALEGSR